MTLKLGLIFSAIIFSLSSFAVPVDWKGTLTYDTEIIKDVRRTSDNCTPGNGSECINPEEDNARFQSMILKLMPEIVVNDGVTVKGEISSGGTRGSNLGESTQINSQGQTYSYYTQNTSSALTLNQLYAELYADTALYRIGRFSKHFGLGAVINSGDNIWDRFYSGYEGIEAQLKLGNLSLTPMWAKLHTSENPNGKYDSYETSISALYDNPNNNFKFGLYYSIKEVESNDDLYGTGSQSVNLIDIYVAKEWDKFSIGFEAPILSGEISNLYGTGDADFDTNAYILETKYTLNNKWYVGLNAGMIQGDDGESDSFEAMYLHPNYKKSHVMFKHNYLGFMDNSYDIFNVSMTNMTYAQLLFQYNLEAWSWDISMMWAKANETAESGSDFYDHERKEVVAATEDQSDDLGYEVNIGFDYQWNPNVVFSGNLGYHFVGDYYAFSNTSDELSVTNIMSTGMSLSINF